MLTARTGPEVPLVKGVTDHFKNGTILKAYHERSRAKEA